MRRPVARRRCLTIFALGSLMTPAHAAWVVDPSARLTTSYQDNVRLEPDNEDGAVLSTATAQTRVANVTETSSISGVAGLTYLTYSGVDGDDLDDRESWFLRADGRRRFERTRFGIDVSAERDVILRRIDAIPEDFQAGGLGALPDPSVPDEGVEADADIDENVVREQIDRTEVVVTPTIAYDVSERSQVELGYTFFGLRFADDQGLLADSDRHSIFARGTRRISPLDSVQLRMEVSRFEPDRFQDSDIYEGTVGWRRTASERLSFGIEVGARQVDGDTIDDWGSLVRADATYRTQTGRLTGTLERSVLPSAFGDVVEADRLSLTWIRQFGPRASFRLVSRAFETRRDGGDSGRDRKFVLVQPQFDWDVTPAWSVTAGYGFRWTDRENQSGSSQGNELTLGIVYRPPSRL